MRGIADPVTAMAAPVDPPVRPPLTRFEDHPLEMFAWARRIPRSRLRDLVFTLLFNTMLAALFTLFAVLFTPSSQWREIAWANFVFANCIGFIIHAEFSLGDWLTGRRCRVWPFMQRAFYYSGVPIVGVVV